MVSTDGNSAAIDQNFELVSLVIIHAQTFPNVLFCVEKMEKTCAGRASKPINNKERIKSKSRRLKQKLKRHGSSRVWGP